MPNVNPNATDVSPGIASPNTYPQWGVKQNGSGGSNDYTIVEATTAAEKTADLSNGYAVWFSTDAAAKAYVSSENSALNGNLGSLGSWVLSGISGTNLVQRALKVIIGGVLVIFGIVHMTGVSGDVAKAVKGVPLPV